MERYFFAFEKTDAKTLALRYKLYKLHFQEKVWLCRQKFITAWGQMNAESFEEAIGLQEKIMAMGWQIHIWEILLQKNMVTVADLHQMQQTLKSNIIHCSACGLRFQTRIFHKEQTRCPGCQATLNLLSEDTYLPLETLRTHFLSPIQLHATDLSTEFSPGSLLMVKEYQERDLLELEHEIRSLLEDFQALSSKFGGRSAVQCEQVLLPILLGLSAELTRNLLAFKPENFCTPVP